MLSSLPFWPFHTQFPLLGMLCPSLATLFAYLDHSFFPGINKKDTSPWKPFLKLYPLVSAP